MGRWAQRSRRGGGPHLENFIVGARLVGSLSLRVYYAKDVDASQLVANTFESLPSGESGDFTQQVAPREVEVVLVGDATGDTSMIYTGTTPGIQTPDGVDY